MRGYRIYWGSGVQMAHSGVNVQKSPWARRFWRGVSLLLSVLCTAGVLAAFGVFIVMVWELGALIGRLTSPASSAPILPVCACVILFVLAAIAYRIGRQLRKRVIDIDAMSALAGSALAVWYLAMTAR